MAKKPAKNIARKRRKVKRKKRVSDITQARKRGKKKKKKKKIRKAKKRRSRIKAPREPKVTRLEARQAIAELIGYHKKQRRKKKMKKRRKTPKLLPPESMAAQVAQRIEEKLIAHEFVRSDESEILMRLIAAEQMGTLDEEYYTCAEDYGWTPQEVYRLWIYN